MSVFKVYQWDPRKFTVVPPPITVPRAYNRWTARLTPGLSDYASTPNKVRLHTSLLPEYTEA